MTWSLVTSPSGVSAPAEQLQEVATNGTGLWVVGSNEGNVWTSNNNGSTWTGPIAVNADLTSIDGIQFLAGKFFCWGTSAVSGFDIFTSTDGATWTQVASELPLNAGLSGSFQGPSLAYNGSNLFVLFGTSGGSGSTATSPDGVTWTMQATYNPTPGNGFLAGIYDGHNFVGLVIDTGLSPIDQIATSIDGATWTFQALNSAPGPDGVIEGLYFYNGHYIVGSGYDASANLGAGQGWFEVATSTSPWNGATDDINTTPIGFAPNVMSADNGTLALGMGSNPNTAQPLAITSTDGSTFNTEDALFPVTGSIEWIAAGPLGTFMAVGFDGSGNPVVSLRNSNIFAPNVLGLTQAAATAVITGDGLILGTVTTSYSSTVPVGLVSAQVPIAGTSVAVGSAINITVSLGPEPFPVPDVLGLPLAIAEVVLAENGFTTGVVSFDDSMPAVTNGNISIQSPTPGTLEFLGTPVDLTVEVEALPFDVSQTVISQYQNSPTLLQLVENIDTYIDPTANLLSFYNLVWNVDTAVGFGLDIWGRIVGVNRVIPIPGTQGTFGFDNADSPPDWENFGSFSAPGAGGPFFAGEVNTGSFTLNDGAFRTLVLAKALANIVATTAPALNQLVSNLFPGAGRAFTIDRGQSNTAVNGMAMTYVFEFPLTTIQSAILNFSGVLPHPAGVLVNVQVAPTGGLFGFTEGGGEPFDQGVFNA